ncbi:MAG: M23 family metallopeptidase [Nocardioides sp.]
MSDHRVVLREPRRVVSGGSGPATSHRADVSVRYWSVPAGMPAFLESAGGKRRAPGHSASLVPPPLVASAGLLVSVAAAALTVNQTGIISAQGPSIVVLSEPAPDSAQVPTMTAHALARNGGISNPAPGRSRESAVDRGARRSPAVAAAADDVDPTAEAPIDEVVKAKARGRRAALAKLGEQADARSKLIAEKRWMLPVTDYTISATFGQSGARWSSSHTGLDFNTAQGVPIVAVVGGTITSTGFDGAYGNKTVLTQEDGTEIWFAHQSAFAVSEGEVVRSGQLIGYVGSTGNSTGSHLHLEVRPGGGTPVDPYGFLVDKGVRP